MRANIEQESAVVPKRRRVAAMVVILLVNHGCDALGVEPVCGTEPGHSTSHDDDVWHLITSSWFLGLRYCCIYLRSMQEPSAIPCRR